MFFETHLSAPDHELFFTLQCKLEKAIYKIAKRKLENIRYATNHKIDYIYYKDLVFYKDLLNDIIWCADWTCDVNTHFVVAKVNNLLNQSC